MLDGVGGGSFPPPQPVSSSILPTVALFMSRESTVEISAELLRRLHRIHRQLTDLRGQLDRGPRQIKAGENFVAKAVAEVDAVKALQKKTKLAADEKQLTLKSRENRVLELKGKLNSAASNKEFSLLKEQIAADEQANAVLADEIFEVLENLDEIAERLRDTEAELAKQQADHQVRVAEVNDKMTLLQSELARVEAELAETEAQIPAAVKADYQRVVDSKGEEGLAPIDGDSCGGCYQTLTTQMRENLQMSQLVRCPNCNAFLYLPEDRRP